MTDSHILDLKNVSYSHDSRGVAGVRDCSLRVAAGKVIGLIGASGDGKSTLLKLISGAIVPHQGTVSRKGEICLIDTIGFAGQLSLDARRIIEDFEMGDQIERSLGPLSQGEMLRFQILELIGQEVSLVCLDDVLSSLDPLQLEVVMRELKAVVKARNCSIIIVSHDAEMLMCHSDELWIMKKGQLVDSGHPRELYNSSRVLWTQQFLGSNNFLTADWCSKSTTEIEITFPWGMKTFDRNQFPEDFSTDHGQILFSLRPERLRLNQDRVVKLQASFVSAEFRGAIERLSLDCPQFHEERPLMALRLGPQNHPVSWISFDWSDLHFIDFL